MTQETDASAPPRNRLLAALPADEWERLRPGLELVPMESRQVVFEPNRPIEYVYFPETSMVSILGLMDDGSAIETATVGNEGMAGVPVFLGAMQMAGQAFVQVSGTAWRMPAAGLRDVLERDGTLASLLGRYTQALFTLVSQSSACNRKHSLLQRCARWLAMTRDRVDGDTFDLTQHFLSQMLGVRRATVNEAASELQARGIIEYTRGRITILDRAGLQATSCACYAIIQGEFARMLDGLEPPTPLDGLLITENGLTITGDGAPVELVE